MGLLLLMFWRQVKWNLCHGVHWWWREGGDRTTIVTFLATLVLRIILATAGVRKGNSAVDRRDSEHLCRLVSNVEWSWNRRSVWFFGIFCTVVRLQLHCCFSDPWQHDNRRSQQLHFFGYLPFGADPASAPTASRGDTSWDICNSLWLWLGLGALSSCDFQLPTCHD